MVTKYQTIIFIFRHGHTNHYYFPLKIIDAFRVLDDLGRRQISEVGQYLKSFNPCQVYSSPLARCVQSSEIIKNEIGLSGSIKTDRRLMEIYSPVTYRLAAQKNVKLLYEVVQKNRGKHVVLVSHQIAITRLLKDLGIKKDEADYPCGMAEGYRLVFAENTFVSAEKLSPAQDVV